eukprot:CAMPEP_0115479884 /NCGR_PEP_ID=MMETSP0271-20121206/56973_1 /TAXON_ID=71861 /ORGANISM="Scrippsiella trochoidea, Strain CCMP3099" /LENGTH=52 /DNA_ID=CAMNT_0002907523 /DNA_START=297 /DNA_END=451 /DNA_ORIENTATION=+
MIATATSSAKLLCLSADEDNLRESPTGAWLVQTANVIAMPAQPVPMSNVSCG